MKIKSKENFLLDLEITLDEEEYSSWLESIGMSDYINNEISAEFEDIEDLLHKDKFFLDIDRYSDISILVKRGSENADS